MATKTLILRPISVTADDESLVTLYPSDTTMANAHMLVNEEVADEDVTYIINSSVGKPINYHFKYIAPSDVVSVTSIIIHTVDKLESGSQTGGGKLYVDTSFIPTIITGTASTTNYQHIKFSSTENSELDFFNNTTTDLYFARYTNSTSSKSSPIRTTQVYVEIAYEAAEVVEPEPSTDIISIKKDNVWTTIDHTSIYHKINNSWVLSDTSILQNNQNFIIKEVSVNSNSV